MIKVNLQYHNYIQVLIDSYYEDVRHLSIREKNENNINSRLHDIVNTVYLPKILYLKSKLKIEKYGTEEQKSLIEQELFLAELYFKCITQILSENDDLELWRRKLTDVDKKLFDQQLVYRDYYNQLMTGKPLLNFDAEAVTLLKKGYSYKDISNILGFPGVCKESRTLQLDDKTALREDYVWCHKSGEVFVIFLDGRAIFISAKFN